MNRQCRVAECGRPYYSLGYCSRHYKRLRVYGDALASRPRGFPPTPPEVRFWRLVEKTETCWLWSGSKGPGGYGHFFPVTTGPNRCIAAHRFSYELANGPIPAGLVIDHLCRVTSCVNPAHLEAVTQAENNRRALPFRSGRRRPRVPPLRRDAAGRFLPEKGER